jgi:hypothetical protein
MVANIPLQTSSEQTAKCSVWAFCTSDLGETENATFSHVIRRIALCVGAWLVSTADSFPYKYIYSGELNANSDSDF